MKLVFPTCSDGRLDSPNHRDHVAYDDRADCIDEATGVDDFERSLCGECPASHPIRIPEIQFYFRIKNYEGGHYVFSNGKGTVHADYLSGWDSSRLQQVLDGCDNDSEAASPEAWCEQTATNPNGLTYRDLPKEKGDTRIRCLLDQIQPAEAEEVDTSRITAELVTGIDTLPLGACVGAVDWANKEATNPICPASMSVADPDIDCSEEGSESQEPESENGSEDSEATMVEVAGVGVVVGAVLFVAAITAKVLKQRSAQKQNARNDQMSNALTPPV